MDVLAARVRVGEQSAPDAARTLTMLECHDEERRERLLQISANDRVAPRREPPRARDAERCRGLARML